MDLTIADELRAGAALALQLLAVVTVGAAAGRRWFRDDRLGAWLVGVLVAIAAAVIIPVALGMVGAVSWVPMALAHLAVLAAGLLVLAQDRSTQPDSASEPDGARSWSYVTVAATAAAIVASLAILFSLGPPSADTDTREYHITNMASWFHPGDLWTLPYQSPAGVTATHPGNSDVLALWLSTPSHGDEVAYAMPIPFVLLALLGSAVLAREIAQPGSKRAAALGGLATAAVLSVPLFVTTQFGSLTNDLPVAACVVTAMALLAVFHRSNDPAFGVATGIAIGLGVGTKYTALVSMAIITLAALWLAPRRWWWTLVPGVVVLAAPWYLRNLLATGNPLFPQPLGPLGGGASPLQVIDAPMLEHIVPIDREVLGRAAPHAARRLGPVLALAAAGTVLLVWTARTSRLVCALAVVSAGALAGYLLTPFSGGGPTGLLFLIVSSFRYSIVFLLLTAVALAAVAPPRVALVALTAVLGWNLHRLPSEAADFRPDRAFGDFRLVAVVVVGLVAGGVVWWWEAVRPILRSRGPWVAGAGVLVAFAVSVLAFHRYDRGHDLRPLEQAMTAFPAGEPVIVLGVFDLRSLLGPRLERPLVGVSRGGEVGEVPYVDEDQIRRLLLDDRDAPRTASAFGPALDDALEEEDAELLVVGPLGDFSYPEGWRPDERWCPLGAVGAITLFAHVDRTPGGCMSEIGS